MTTEQTLWQRRWESLDNTISIIEDRYESFTKEDSSRRENTLFTLLVQLRKFAAGQFRFFHDGFYTKRFVDLAPIPDTRSFAFPQYITGHSIEAYILHNTMRQIAEDIIVIQRASEQRMIAQLGLSKGIPGRENILFTLEDVDKLAFTALNVVAAYLQNPQQALPESQKQTVLTYFRRSANVRVIPYAPVAMIGIPITAVGLNSGIGVTEDLLAIPHEVAHHLYWNGWAESGQRINIELASRVTVNPVRHWQQEIFADVVGCLIGGPAVARSFVDLQLTSIAAEFLHANDPHPMPALRPLIYAYTLEKIGDTASATAVRNVWQTHLDNRKTFVNRELLFAAYQIVDDILGANDESGNFIPGVIDQTKLSLSQRWSDDGDYDLFYEAFESRIPSLVAGADEEALDPQNFNVQSDWRGRAVELGGPPELANLPENWTTVDEIGAAAAGNNAIAVAAATWLRIYAAGGWITSGPGGGNLSGD